MQKYIGRDVQLIYIDSKRNVTIRSVKVLVVGDQRFMAYCYQAKSVRTFNKSGIVDMEVLRHSEETRGKRQMGIIKNDFARA